jgi:hypothetical protein
MVRDGPAFFYLFPSVIINSQMNLSLKISRWYRQPVKGKTGPILKSGSRFLAASVISPPNSWQ